MEEHELLQAKEELAKLPLLGPVMWLLSRDASTRDARVAELDWRFMPPLILDQLQIVTRFDVPWGFSTWAYVSEEVHQRLCGPDGQLSPHEWHSGSIPWLIEACAPFGGWEEVAQSAVNAMNVLGPAHVWVKTPEGLELRTISPNVQR
ncbi:toxin-activating lysine-acyltransferase [Roseateles sp.]|uniref:toxin-activating lysine-acyltransferase n=1 Tax=Roseateles sp. TaxID=1971397 RepID=UPI003D14DF1B